MFTRATILAIAGMLGTAAYYLVPVVGPELFSFWMNQQNVEEERQARAQQTDLMGRQIAVIERNNDVLAILQKTLEDTSASSPPLAGPARSADDPPRQAADPDPIPSPRVAPMDEPVPNDVVALPPAPAPPRISEGERPGPTQVSLGRRFDTPAPDTPETPRIPESPDASPPPGERSLTVVGIFENEGFSLCDRDNFKARIGSAGDRIDLTSGDRSLPGAGFRGFEVSIPLLEEIELWPGCTVAAAIEGTPGGGRRIIMSMGVNGGNG